MALTTYIRPRTSVSPFKYLGGVLLDSDDNCTALIRNLRRASKIWERLFQVFVCEGEDERSLGMFYIVVIQGVLIYGSEKWAAFPHIGRMLGGFHHRVLRRLTGNMTQQNLDRMWAHPSLEEAMTEAGVQEVETYVTRRRNTVAQFITTTLWTRVWRRRGTQELRYQSGGRNSRD